MTGGAATTDPTEAATANRAAWLGFGIGLCVALACAWHAVRDLSWPAEADLYRDLGAANALLDGNWWGDHTYPGEVRWYPPLLPALVAGIARLSGVATHIVYTRGGPWLNLLGPIFFFLVARRWVGALAATAAVFGLMFFGPQSLEPWKYATYSAWLWPFAFALGPTFATLWAHPAFGRRTPGGPQGQGQADEARPAPPRRVRSLLTGALLGLTFLVHPAPAFLLALAMAIYAMISSLAAPSSYERRRPWMELILIAVVSLALALPYMAPLIRTYHLHTINSDPARKVGVTLHEILMEFVRPRTAVAAVGLVELWRSGAWRVWRTTASDADAKATTEYARTAPRRLLFAFAVATIALFGYGLAAQILENFHLLLLPMLVPNLHFHLYLNLLELLAFGVGFLAIIRALARRIGSAGKGRVPEALLSVGTLVVLAVLLLPRHLEDRDLSHYREASLGFAADPALGDLYAWLRAHTPADTVILSHGETARYTVGAAGRGVVRMPMNYSNPYVSFTQREADNDRMYQALQSGDTGVFSDLTARYRVAYVALEGEAPAASVRSLLRPVGRFGRVDLEEIQVPSRMATTTRPASDRTALGRQGE
ncbi:MAG TPA: hypothetical protein VLC06_24660 [Polyangia bacterium]|nr:hypothetical protein [Polyangia bacterium]